MLTPYLSSLWLNLVTPVNASVARPLVEGLRNPTIAREERIRKLLPSKLTPFDEAARRALTEQHGHLPGSASQPVVSHESCKQDNTVRDEPGKRPSVLAASPDNEREHEEGVKRERNTERVEDPFGHDEADGGAGRRIRPASACGG